MVLVGATTDASIGTVQFRQDGTITFRADGGKLGRAAVTVLVSDGSSLELSGGAGSASSSSEAGGSSTGAFVPRSS